MSSPNTVAVSQEVLRELARARKKFAPFNSAHEGYATLLEEADELWDEIKGPDDSKQVARMRAEAIQVAAMAIRFIEDVCDK
jgi:hypothetical protein